MNILFPNNSCVSHIARMRALKAVLIMLPVLVFLCAEVWGDEQRRELWIISTRCAPLSGDLECGQKEIRYWKLLDNCQWQTADDESFRAGDDPAVQTTIIIHGNRDNADDAIQFAWPIYLRVLKNDDKPFRLVIWSWPSERMSRRNRPDVQLKFYYCDAQAYYLASCLKHLRQDVPLCLIGYSMGARIAAAGLHLLAGGEVACRSLPEQNTSDQLKKRAAPVRVLTIAAAIDADSLSEYGTYNLALSQADSILVALNGCDRVLKFYPRTYGRRGPQALSYVGPAGRGEYQKIELLDISCEVGRQHLWKNYLTSGSLLHAIDRYTE